MFTLKEKYNRHSLGRLCLLFGITRQAYYQYFWYSQEKSFEHKLVLNEVTQIRKRHPRLGGKKLYELLLPFLMEHQIKLGRDALFDLLASHNLLVRRRKRSIHTTNSFHWLRKYPNLIRNYAPGEPNQLWVSDITYWKVENKHLYISFITDAFSHKIIGYHVAETLAAVESVEALKMALSGLKTKPEYLIHHSDRGIQYCSSEYVKLLQDHEIFISMTESGDPLENPVAERVNGIIKDEYLEFYEVTSINEAKILLERVVGLYNGERPHMSIGNKPPKQVHESGQKEKNLWKTSQ